MNVEPGGESRTDDLPHGAKVIISNPLKQFSLATMKERMPVRDIHYIFPSFFGNGLEKLQHETCNRSRAEGHQDPGTHANYVLEFIRDRIAERVFDRKTYGHSGAAPVNRF
jgi:hypothetical protein